MGLDELDLEDEEIDLGGGDAASGDAAPGGGAPGQQEDMPVWMSFAITAALFVLFFHQQILARLRAPSTTAGGGGGGAATAKSAEEMSSARLRALDSRQGGGDAGGSELRRRAAATEGGAEGAAGAIDEASEAEAAEAARAEKAATARRERDEMLRRRVAELNAEAEAKEQRQKSAEKAEKAKERAEKAAAAAAAAEQKSPPAAAKPKPAAAKVAQPPIPDAPMGRVASLLGTQLPADAQALGEALAAKLAAQGGAAAKLALLAGLQRAADRERKAASDAAHAQLASSFCRSLAKALAGVLGGLTSSTGDLLVTNLTSDSPLPPQLLGAALESLGTPGADGTPDLKAAWAAIQEPFGLLWNNIRGPADSQLCERLAGIDSPTASVSAMASLLSVPVVAQALAANIRSSPWIPQRRAVPMHGRKPGVLGADLELIFLGPLFGLGVIPDAARKLHNPLQQRNPWNAGRIGEFFFPNGVFRRRQIEIEGDVSMARDQLNLIQDQLVRATKALLRKERGSREHMLDWLHHAVECNANRARVYSQSTSLDSSDNFLINLGYVLLRLCEPFMSGAGSKKVAPTIQSEFAVRCARYVENPEHSCSYESETRFAVETGELDAWVDVRNLARIKQFEAAKRKRAEEEAAASPTAHMNGTVHHGAQSEAEAASESDDSDEDAMDALLREEQPEPEPAADVAAPAQEFSFVTEIFFLTARALHHGLIPSMSVSERQPHAASTYIKLMHAMNPLVKMINELRGGRHEELENAYAQMYATKLCFDAAMLDPRLLDLGMKFYSLCSRWLMKLACGIDEAEDHEIELSALDLPLKSPAPMAFATLPEFFATDICEFILLVAEWKPSELYSAAGEFDQILSLLVVLLESPGYVRNPHLRMKFVAVITLLIPPKAPRRARGSDEERPDFSAIFNTNAISKRFLPPALIRLYVDIENTGSHNQFHEKVGPRNDVYKILEHLCDPAGSAERAQREGLTIAHPPDPVYAKNFFAYLSSDVEVAKKFISMLLGDTQLHFDDGLMQLAEAKVLQDEEDSGAWEGLPQSTSQDADRPSPGSLEEKKKQLESAEGRAKSLLKLTSKTIGFISYASRDCPEPFLEGIFIQRIAQMLNSFVSKLVGRNQAELKVRNKEDLEFKPLELLEEVGTVFTNLYRGSLAAGDAESSSFVGAMVAMGQYDPALYARAGRLLSTKGQRADIAAGFAELVAAVDAASEAEVAEEMNLDECPDEFLDPLTFMLMEDPVDLPCGTTIDRVTIERSLLDNEINPFSRDPLTKDELVPNDELRGRIEAWKAEQR